MFNKRIQKVFSLFLCLFNFYFIFCNMFLYSSTQQGDSAVYWAARQGQLEVIKYLEEAGVPLDLKNKVKIL